MPRKIVRVHNAPSARPQDDALIPRRKAFREYLNIGITTGWRREREDPEFPKPVVIGVRRYGYRKSDLLRYIASRPAKDDTTPASEPRKNGRFVSRSRRAR
jgi:predicted DNA-binding transcriptional regulator AlpA